MGARPGPLEVVAAEPAGHVHSLADEMQARHFLSQHPHPALQACRFDVLILEAGQWQWIPGAFMDEAVLADPDKMDKLIARQGEVQDKIDALDAWELDTKLERAMDALRCPPDDQLISTLSGGERRRVALCKLLLEKPDLLLLDEPTSSVDPKTESLIYDQLFDEFKGKAVLSSLHRLHLLTKFDYVYVLENGRIVDQCTFESLRANSPVFQELWKHQEKTSS